MTNESSETLSKRRPRGLVIILIIIALAAVATSAVFYHKYRSSQNTAQAQQKQLLNDLSKVIQLPNTTPTIVTVADKSKLTNKTLAARVQNKDMLIIYDGSQRIIVYRPSTKKVVDMLTFESQSAAAQPKP